MGRSRRRFGRTPIERFFNTLNDLLRLQKIAGVIQKTKPEDDPSPFVALLSKSWNETIAHPESPLKLGSTLPDLASLDATDPSRLGYYYLPDESDSSRHLMLVRVYEHTEYTRSRRSPKPSKQSAMPRKTSARLTLNSPSPSLAGPRWKPMRCAPPTPIRIAPRSSRASRSSSG